MLFEILSYKSQGLVRIHVDIAHSVERQTSNLKVAGSNPVIGAKTTALNYLGLLSAPSVCREWGLIGGLSPAGDLHPRQSLGQMGLGNLSGMGLTE